MNKVSIKKKEVVIMKAIYLDHAATTPLRDSVISEITRAMSWVHGNPSSVHRFGRQAMFEIEQARDTIANGIGAHSDEIVFTSGGTEGDNTVLRDIPRQLQHKGRHVISTNVEHNAVSEPLALLEAEGFDVTYLPVSETGSVTVKQVEEALREDTILVSIMYGNNEIGSLNPIQEIGNFLEKMDVLFHTDAVQAFGTEKISVDRLKVDYLTASSHKINGPKGTGLLFIKRGAPVPKLLYGGEQESKRRAGTENLPAIVGFAEAVRLIKDESPDVKRETYQRYRHIILNGLKEHNISYQVNGHPTDYLPHILNIRLKGVSSQLLLSRLDLKGFAVSIGSACTAGTVTPSHVLEAIYTPNHVAINESIRISFGYGLTEESIVAFTNTLITEIKALIAK